LEGAGGEAGELGHTPLVFEGRPCRCGAQGCLEAYAGGWANVFNPERIVLGGGVIEGQPELVEEAGEQARAQALGPHAEGLEVTPAHLGGEAVAVGAALMARGKEHASTGPRGAPCRAAAASPLS
jgi:predicted NBD/HSP70 family sugar kinase